jgi:opacity protein-like surface antigen
MKTRRATAIVSGLLLTLTAGTAYADGMVSLKDTVVAPAPSWSGLYFGMSVGYGRNSSDNNYEDEDGFFSSVEEHATGGLVTAIWGYDCMLHDKIVVGAFADFDWSNIDRGYSTNHLTIDRSWAIGGRAGYLVTPNTLLYGTAGYTRAHFDNEGWWDIDDGGPILEGRDERWFSGYFLGGGVETRLRGNFFVRGEVRYANYGSEVTNSGFNSGAEFVDEEDPQIWTGRLGITYKIGRGESTYSSIKDGDGSDYGSSIKVISYNGVDVAKDIWAIYSGSYFYLNGDVMRDGIVARTFGYYADFNYTAGTPPTDFDGKDRSLDAMIGYMHYFGETSVTGFVGMEVRDVDIDPDDPTNKVSGTQTGFKVAGELETGDNSPLYVALDGSYSTAFNSYYASLRTGYNKAGRYIVGPEGELYSDEGELTWRLGGFVTIPFTLRNTQSEVSFSAGHQWVEDSDEVGTSNTDTGSTRGGEGAYFNSYLKFLF